MVEVLLAESRVLVLPAQVVAREALRSAQPAADRIFRQACPDSGHWRIDPDRERWFNNVDLPRAGVIIELAAANAPRRRGVAGLSRCPRAEQAPVSQG
jgi:hypothetical protein